MVLLVEAHAHVVAQRHLAARAVEPSRNLAQQGGLARTVGADDADPLAAAHLEGHVPVELEVTVGHRQVSRRQHHRPALDDLAKAERGGVALGRRRFDALELLELADAALHLPGLRVLVAEPVNPGLGLADVLLLPLERLLLLLALQRLFVHVPVVVAAEAEQLAALDLDDAVRDGVEHLPVVRSDDQRLRAGLEIVLQPFAGLDVEVVLRLIEQQQVGVFQQHQREHQPGALAAAQRAEGKFEFLLAETEAAQHGPDARAEFIAAPERERVLQPAVRLQGRVVAVGHALLERRQFPFLVDQVLKRLLHNLEDAGVGRRLGELGQHGDARALHALDSPAVRHDRPGDDAEQGGLASAVAPDQTDVLPLFDTEIDRVEHGGAREGFRDVFQPYDTHDTQGGWLPFFVEEHADYTV